MSVEKYILRCQRNFERNKYVNVLEHQRVFRLQNQRAMEMDVRTEIDQSINQSVSVILENNTFIVNSLMSQC